MWRATNYSVSQRRKQLTTNAVLKHKQLHNPFFLQIVPLKISVGDDDRIILGKPSVAV